METGKERPANNAGTDEERKQQTQRVNSRNAKEAGIVINCEENRPEAHIENIGANYKSAVTGEEKRKNLVNTEEEPMDLTFSQRLVTEEQRPGSSFIPLQDKNFNKVPDSKIYDEAKTNACFTIAKIVQADHLCSNANVPKKRGRKRKASIAVPSNRTSSACPTYDNPEYVHTVDSRQAEVLMAAKSLFSKRTRTLYHWMYPNTPKAQLKSAVSMSWETLGVQEKEFYISQVLGRFGFPQSSLMVNPQLGGLRGLPVLPPLDLSTPSHLNSETHRAVSTILEGSENGPNECGPSWGPHGGNIFSAAPHTKRVSRKRGRLGRPPGSRSQKHLKEQSLPIRPVTVESIAEDFHDDPELRQEFEQFKWALHINK